MRLLKEPLFHFILIGAALFVIHGVVNRAEVSDAGIVVTSATVEQLAETFSNDWNREPSAEELDTLIEDYIREEIAFREGLALGLDQNDPVIRQRIRQKLETVYEEEAAQVRPTDAELQTYLTENADLFREPLRVSFYQVFLTREHQDRAGALREELKTTEKHISTFGDPAPMGQHNAKVTADEIDRAFGLGFSDHLAGLPEKNWSGPIESEYGFHLVYIEERLPGELPDLGRIRNMVAFEWENAQRFQRLENHYSELRKKYNVRVEGPVD